MRVFAHRVNTMDFEIQPSFDILDEDLEELIETELGYHYTQAGYKLSIKDLDVLILKLKDTDPLQAASFQRDKLWAQLHRTKWVMYTIIGDSEWNGDYDEVQ